VNGGIKERRKRIEEIGKLKEEYVKTVNECEL
jgi:hypothetical protein